MKKGLRKDTLLCLTHTTCVLSISLSLYKSLCNRLSLTQSQTLTVSFTHTLSLSFTVCLNNYMNIYFVCFLQHTEPNYLTNILLHVISIMHLNYILLYEYLCFFSAYKQDTKSKLYKTKNTKIPKYQNTKNTQKYT